MTTNATTKKFFQLVNIPDYRYDGDRTDIDYGDIASDCDTKTISLLEAIGHISLCVFTLSDSKECNKEKINNLSCIITDLAELAIATNKISQTATYLSGVQDGNNSV
ncbi:hypothetical protein NNO04_20750 [Citrobacter sp. Awk 4]|uniref:hypothetical protein n=1 Tax=Citrobacter sp. Awk 4 TaxID=2963955 RepID=UPI002303B210|nr:hypothetical protein [Citrobacter sp. Awk 4]MDA8481104.1 hypothetical protein [Citrobacter sp. Awk 4]